MKQIDGQIGLFDVKPVNEKNECLGEPCAHCDVEWWPEPTHAPADSEEVKKGLLKPYVGAYTQLDFSLPCPSIFDTSEEIKEKYGIRAVRPLAQKTMDRIARGFIKFVLNNPKPFTEREDWTEKNEDT